MLLNYFCMLDVARCSPRTTVLEAAHLMRRHHTGDLVVVEDDGEERHSPLGVITDRDIVVEVLAQGADPATTLVSHVMRTPVVIANAHEDSSQVLERMRVHGVRRIPVVGDDGWLVGIVTADDMLKQLATDAHMLTEIVSKEQSKEQRARR